MSLTFGRWPGLSSPRPRPSLPALAGAVYAGERSDWGVALAQAWALKGDTAHSRIYADSARLAFEQMFSRTPLNDQNMSLLGLSLAYLGRYDEAIAAASSVSYTANAMECPI